MCILYDRIRSFKIASFTELLWFIEYEFGVLYEYYNFMNQNGTYKKKMNFQYYKILIGKCVWSVSMWRILYTYDARS